MDPKPTMSLSWPQRDYEITDNSDVVSKIITRVGFTIESFAKLIPTHPITVAQWNEVEKVYDYYYDFLWGLQEYADVFDQYLFSIPDELPVDFRDIPQEVFFLKKTFIGFYNSTSDEEPSNLVKTAMNHFWELSDPSTVPQVSANLDHFLAIAHKRIFQFEDLLHQTIFIQDHLFNELGLKVEKKIRTSQKGKILEIAKELTEKYGEELALKKGQTLNSTQLNKIVEIAQKNYPDVKNIGSFLKTITQKLGYSKEGTSHKY